MEKQENFITKEDDMKNNIVGGIAVDRLRSLIERIERLEEEKKGIQSDIRDIFVEAKNDGFDIKAMRAILKLRALNAADRDAQELILETYRKALDLQGVKMIKTQAGSVKIYPNLTAKCYMLEIGDDFNSYSIGLKLTELVALKNELNNLIEKAYKNEKNRD